MIKVGIVGYGNLGRGVELALKAQPDMELVGIFSRRDPASLDTSSPAYHLDDILDFKDKIDVLILCGGSKDDIPKQGPALVEHFNTVDAFDTHAQIPAYFAEMDQIAKKSEKTAIIATGWDPGLFSLNRVLAEAVLPQGETFTFWGRGLSQGHSDAVRRVEGVKAGVQYTIPNEDMIEGIRAGKSVDYTSSKAHQRLVYVVLEDGADPEAVETEIVNMPNYFADYETEVRFIDEAEMARDHQGMPHGGRVIRRGNTADENQSVIEFALDLDSNPEFTATVNVAYARAAARLAEEEDFGAKTVVDIAPKYLIHLSDEDLRQSYI